MDITDPIEGTSTDAVHPQKKFHVPPITIDNVTNQAALLKHLQQITKLKLEAKLIGTKFLVFPQTPYAYSLIRRYIAENSLEGYTYMLPEDKKLRAVIRGLPIDMPPMEIISDLDKQGFRNRDSNQLRKVTVEILRKKYGPPQCFRCQGFSTPANLHAHTQVRQVRRQSSCQECEKLFGDKPKCCLCGGEHPANFLGCPKNPKPRIDAEKEKKRQQRAALTNPEPTKVNFWEQRTQSATQSQQPISTSQPGPSTAPPPSSKPVTSQNSPSDLFEQLKNRAVQDTFELLEQFITIATTIPSKVGRLRAIRNLLADEINFLSPPQQYPKPHVGVLERQRPQNARRRISRIPLGI
ncbi:nucleic-acid-binding protein from transposon X-element [Trichonephila clavata]|uniref:Nucleic-acid-binding protein from transposon X-element n=1 Tax=Trichonephila clavata TaxID=2740835 RepID=A0A8X6KCZ6_TRICU|nr:nucleic-acid-binding protein from transposon X-element [Trichonephila clavata]